MQHGKQTKIPQPLSGVEEAGGSDEGEGVRNATGGRGARGNQHTWNSPPMGAESSQDAAAADAAAPLFLRFFLSAVGAAAISWRSSLSLLRFWRRRVPESLLLMSAPGSSSRSVVSLRATPSDGSSTPAGLRNFGRGAGAAGAEAPPSILSIVIVIIVILPLVGNGAADGGARAAGVGLSPSSSSVLVLILISGMSDGISRMSSRALLELRDLARLVSFVEEPGPKLDIDVSRFEAG